MTHVKGLRGKKPKYFGEFPRILYLVIYIFFLIASKGTIVLRQCGMLSFYGKLQLRKQNLKHFILKNENLIPSNNFFHFFSEISAFLYFW